MDEKTLLTTENGAPVASNQDSISPAPRGPLLVQDWQLFEKHAHSNRERIPERIVHARGPGAYGTLTITGDMSRSIEDVGKAITRWGVVIIFAWIGGMKFTAYEAKGIQPLVAHSPLLSWTYDFLSVRSFSTMLGFLEIGIALLIALRSVSPKASAIGSLLAVGLFATTLSMIFTTPGWEPSLGFPALSQMPGQLLLKDIVYLGASVWMLGESLKAVEA